MKIQHATTSLIIAALVHTSAPPSLADPAPIEFDGILFDDFDNGDYRNVNNYSTGSTSGFWSDNARCTEDTGNSLLVQAIDSSGGGYQAANVYSAFSGDWNFFDQALTLSVRGISFDGTTGSQTLPDTKMQQWFTLMGAVIDPTIHVTLPDQVGHKYRRTIFGANCLQMLNRADYTLPGFISKYVEAGRPFFRFPGGTPSNFYNYETGFLDTSGEDDASRRATLNTWNSSITNNHGPGGMTPDSFFEFAEQTGADYSLTVNMTSFAPTNNRSYMQAIQALGATPHYIELGNELYFGSYANYMEDGATYVAEAAAHANAMREVFPDAKYGALMPSQLYTSESFLPNPGNPGSDDRQEGWYDQLAGNQDFFDALIIHLYSSVGMANDTPTDEFIPYEEAYKNCLSHADSELPGVLATLKTDFPQKEIWVTEFHVGGFGGNVGSYRLRHSYLGSLYAAYFFFKLLGEPRVTITHWHSFTHMFSVPSGTLDENSVLGSTVIYEVFKTLGKQVGQYGYCSPVKLSNIGTYGGSNGYDGTFDDVFACYLHNNTNGTLVLVNKLDREYDLGTLSVANRAGSNDVHILGATQVRPDDSPALTNALSCERNLAIQSYTAGEVPGLSLPPYSITYIELGQDWEIDGLPAEVFVIEHHTVDRGSGTVEIIFPMAEGYVYTLERSADLSEGAWVAVEGACFVADESGRHTFEVGMPGDQKQFYRVIRTER